MTEDEYRQSAAAKGYGTPVQKIWDAGLINAAHTHQTSLYLLIQKGAMQVNVAEDRTQALHPTQDNDTGQSASGPVPPLHVTLCGPGDCIEVPGHLIHEERVSSQGVTFLVAQKAAP